MSPQSCGLFFSSPRNTEAPDSAIFQLLPSANVVSPPVPRGAGCPPPIPVGCVPTQFCAFFVHKNMRVQIGRVTCSRANPFFFFFTPLAVFPPFFGHLCPGFKWAAQKTVPLLGAGTDGPSFRALTFPTFRFHSPPPNTMICPVILQIARRALRSALFFRAPVFRPTHLFSSSDYLYALVKVGVLSNLPCPSVVAACTNPLVSLLVI